MRLQWNKYALFQAFMSVITQPNPNKHIVHLFHDWRLHVLDICNFGKEA